MKISHYILALLIAMQLVSFMPAVAQAAPSVESILPKASVGVLDSETPAIPTRDLKDKLVPQAVKMFLGVVATISFVMFLYAGVNMVISQGNEEELTKFKNILIWSVVGLLFITLSFAIVKGVLQLDFSS